MRAILLAAAILLVSCGDDNGKSKPPPQPPTPVNLMSPAIWEIGPIIKGENSSVGLPLHPAAHPEGWVIELPQPTREAGHAHYVTFRHGSLAGKSRIVMRYRVEMDDGAKIVPQDRPELVGALTMYFQRRNDPWTAMGPYEAFRWYATPHMHRLKTPGEFEQSISLSEKWTAVQTSSSETNPSGFQSAKLNADRVGFVLGGGDGAGHGVFATGPARIIVTDFRVE